MITCGIDLASQPRATAAALVQWQRGRAELVELRLGVDDDGLLTDFIPRAATTGIDAPFGWPQDFVELVSAHAEGRDLPPDFDETRRQLLRLRRTDRHVHSELGRTPLSVSSDWIALVAMRCVHLLARLGVRDRSGAQGVCEVYPAAALRSWGLPDRGYKGPARTSARVQLLAELEAAAPWLRLRAAQREQCVASDDCLDALVSALIARASARGLCPAIPKDARLAAAREGWIVLPHADALASMQR